MKRKFDHPAPSEGGKKYWRSLDELAATPGFKSAVEREFPEGASSLDGVDRRQFMKIMAASFALGGVGLAGCRRPESNILPFGKSVEGIIPGLPQYYATAMPLRNSAIPLVAETHQGRPTKLEGNPAYTPHGGATSMLAQASILDLYDPDRATKHTKGGDILDVAGVNALIDSIASRYAGNGGAGLAVLAGVSSSPTRARLVSALKAKYPQMIWAQYDAVVDEAPATAAGAAYGRSVKPLYRFAKAKRILSIDADFFHAESGSLYYARDFSKGRKVVKKDDPMNRLYVAESGLSLTGSMADHRLRLATSNMLALANAVAAKVSGGADTGSFPEKASWIAECAADLVANRGASVVIAGAHLPAEVHSVVFAINSALGAIGTTVDYVETAASSFTTIQSLAATIKSGAVKTLFVLGGNPVFNAPAELNWSSLQKSVAEVVRLGYSVDETSEIAAAHIASAHYLESWGDARTVDGTIVPIQPMIMPLFNGLTEIEVISRLSGDKETDGFNLVFKTHTAGAENADKAFRKILHDGLVEGSAYPIAAAPAAFSAGAAPAATVTTFSRDNLEVRFIVDHKMDDGSYLNNGWLQECPDPISKITWDNAILVSPKLAKEMGFGPKASVLQVARVEDTDYDRGREKVPVCEVTVNGVKVKGPVHIQPGLNNYTIFLVVGYGRTKVGHVGKESGFNAYPLRTSDTFSTATGGKLVKTEETFLLANTQEHWSMEGRDLVREANHEEYQKHPDYVKEVGLESHSPAIYGEELDQQPHVGEGEAVGPDGRHLPRGGSLYETPAYTGAQQWGMSIDLNTCIGCNACVVACQAENNVPIVGKEQVLRGREMHWLRIDRYYSDGEADSGAFGLGQGNRELPEEPQISLQPIACQMCELAPCETVCPVNATVHDDEGLNVMAYNRCIGTRYCANNCPYKVRRFNFFDFNERQIDSLYMGPVGPHGMPELVKMAKNPQVTVRMRGVMEKCTYCVQRIENGKIRHKVKVAQEGHPADIVVPDGEIKSACMQVCPVDAIVFGNIMDPNSAVVAAKNREQDYQLLGYLNTRPRTSFSGKLRNPNPKMPDYKALPFSREEREKKSYPPGWEQKVQAQQKKETLIAPKLTGGLS